MRQTHFILILIFFLFVDRSAFAACGGTTRTWDSGGGNNRWTTNNNWSGNNEPDSTGEDAVIVSGDNGVTRMDVTFSIGCLEVQSGVLRTTNSKTYTINGDYFRATNLNTFLFRTTDTGSRIVMAGSGDQTFEVTDPVVNLRIDNNNTVTLTDPFTIHGTLDWESGSTGTLLIDSDVVLSSSAAAITVPSGATLELASGASLVVPAGLTVNGTLKLKAGSSLKIGNGSTLSVASGAIIQLTGADGNPASIASTGAGTTFTFSLAGSMDASYFRIDRLDASGIDVAATGVIQGLDYGEFHYLADSGYAITLASGATIPSTADEIGFFDDDDHGTVLNIDANSYNGTDITFDDWVGGVGGEGSDTDPNDKIDWGTQGGTALSLSDNTSAGNPPATIASGATDQLFGTFAFAINQADTATNITSVTVTMTGTAGSGDVSAVRAYYDAGGGTSCVYDSGTDTQIGSDQTLSGTPLTTTFSIGTGNIQTSSDTDVECIHIVADISASAQHAKTVRFSIESTGDVTNSQGYSFSGSAGPPVSGGSSSIDNGGNLRIWQGDGSDNDFSRNGNWNNGNAPTSGEDCIIGPGVDIAFLDLATQACRNGDLDSGGEIDWDNTTRELAFYGGLTVDSGYTFTDATAGPGVLAMRGASNQSLRLGTAFGGDFLVANTGTSPDDVVSVQSNATLNGDLTISDGTLRIVSGVTLTVNADITVASGGTLDIEPGGTLALGDGFTLTVASGGVLEMVGSVSQQAVMTSSTPETDAYNVVINGEISARYYKFDSLGSGGVSVESGATINATNHLQNGSFTYPVDSSMTLLLLKRQVPTNSMDDTTFELNGSAATTITNIDTTGAAAGTLTIDGYSGDISGPSFDTDPTYTISWTGATNTIEITQDAVGPVTVAAGGTYQMGRFGFEQDQAGASFNDADITSLTLTLTGNGAGSDVDEVRAFYDDDCDSSAGSLLGSGTFSGNPAKVTFAIGAGDATVESDVTTPPKRCIYIEYDIANAAQDGKTLGVKLNASGDFVNDQSYAASGSTTFPVTLGTAATISGAAVTLWTGTTSTDWTVAGNWSAGVPDSTKTCEISVQTNQPTVPALTTAACNSVIINSGATLSLMMATSNLDVYGAFENSGTFTQGLGTLQFRGTGDQTITSATTLADVDFDKTSGTVQISGTVTITDLDLSTGTFDLVVGSGKTLILPNGVTVSGANVTLEVQGSGELQIGNGQTLTVSGGTFETTGVADQYPQSTANKATVSVQGGTGSWGFNATAGTVSLSGFLLDNVDTNGVRFSGTTTLSTLAGGQLRNLSETYASVNGFVFNTSNVPATANDIGWNWSPDNTPPGVSDGYTLASSTGCGSNTITFDRWFGDFFVGWNQPDTSTKVSATNCTISIAASASPVTLTNFFVTGYDGAVSLDWITGLETSHSGFNVYRSDKPYAGYVQINSELIKNVFFSTAFHGTYRFVDNNVVNGKRYYYVIEDVAFNGAMNTHGPVTVIPTAANGAPPATEDEVSDGSSASGADVGNAPDTGEITNAALVDLGNGAHILAQTSGSFRLEVIPPAAVYSASPWDGSYEQVAIPGYSRTLDAGHPELAERYILVEVDNSYTTAALLGSEVEEAAVTSHKMQPAPSFAPDADGELQASYALDGSAYASSDYAPTSFFSVEPALVEVAGRKFAKVRIHPLLYRASAEQVRSASRIVLDVGLDGKSWTASAPDAEVAQSPSVVEGVVRIRYRSGGMHVVHFEDLLDLGIEGPFDGVDVNALRLYFHGREIPLEVDSADGLFGSGDSLRFWATHIRHKDTDFGEVVLSSQALGDSSGAALRVSTVDGSPGALPDSPLTASLVRAEVEQDLVFISGFPIAEQEDHFYWGTIYTLGGAGTDGLSFFDFDIDLPKLDRFSGDVRINLYVIGRNLTAANVTNHLGLWVNKVPYRVGDAKFGDGEPTRLSLTLPASYFIAGTNSLRIEAMGDTVPVNSWEAIDVDRVQIEYYAAHEASEGRVVVTSPNFDQVVTLSGFDPAQEVRIYDTSDPDALARVTGVSTFSPDGGVTQSYEFAPSADGDYGYRYHAMELGAFLRPSEMFLEEGFDTALRSTARGADLIVIGHSYLLDAVEELVEHRRAQGLRVVQAPLAQIYGEFSNGLPLTEGIRDFLSYARANWQAPAPQYVLFVGDATSDPRNRLGGNASDDLMPIPIDHGYFIDFGSDTWYVREEGSVLPTMAVGRLPTQDPEVIRKYVTKLLAYESGTLAPSGASSLKLNFVSDSDGMNERFRSQSQALIQSIQSARPEFSVDEVDRGEAASDAEAKQAINSALNDGVLLMNYLGHGAEGQWASGAFYDKGDAAGLTNNKLPIVVALNCLNTHFYRPDGSTTLGESFVLNPTGGSVAFYGSTSMTVPGAQTALAQALYGRLAQETAVPYHRVALGDLILQAQTSVAGIASMSDTLKSYTLFGDPSMPLPQSVFAPSPAATPSAAAPAPASSEGGGCGAARWPVQPSDAGFTFPLLLWLLWSVALRRRRSTIP